MANEVASTQKKSRSKSRTRNDDEQPLAGTTMDAGKDATRARFNEVLQNAYLNAKQGETKKKKKKNVDMDEPRELKPLRIPKRHVSITDTRSSNEPAQLENLKRGEGIRKDEEDKMLLANTFDPDDLKSVKSNKRRQKENEERKNGGIENQAYHEEDEKPIVHKKGKKKAKKAEVIDKEMSISELDPPENDDEIIPSPTPQKRVVRKKKPRPTSPEVSQQVLSEDAETADDLDKSKDVLSDGQDEEAKVKKKKAKKKKKKATAQTGDQANEEAAAAEAEIRDEGRIMGLTVHRTDKLKTDFFIAHPLVRVTLVDESTGHHIKKQHKERPVTSYYEAENENVDFVLPIMTQPFDFKQNKSTLPVWEELIIFNENFNYIIQDKPKVIMFFEILDFVSMNTASKKYNAAKQEGGWHRIAWAFLKVVGATGQVNTDKKVRLQLYQPPLRYNAKPGQVEVFQWWNSGQRILYPSTVYVTIKGIVPPSSVEAAARSMFATQAECGRNTFADLQQSLDHRGRPTTRDGIGKRGPTPWSRLAGQVCKVPNTIALSLPAARKGCFVVRFSNDGKSLACGCHDMDGYPILVYEIPSGSLRGTFNGHYSILYDLCWSKMDNRLISASADGTARVWDAENMSNAPVKTLPHPAFVYVAKFHIRVTKIVVTGGYDRMIRVWTLHGDDSHAQLLQELDGHESFVNALCFDEEGLRLFSGDSLGKICMWKVYVTEKPSSKGVLRDWSMEKEINDPEMKGVAITSLKMHPSGRRLLVHCKDNTVRMIDLRICGIMQRYLGMLNFRDHIRSTISPCGSFVFAGSEDCCAYVWNTDTGDQVAMYSELGFTHAVCDVDFHPHDHMAAFCSFGDSHQVLVYKFDHKVAQRDAGFEPKDTAEHRKSRAMSPDVKTSQIKSDDERLETSRNKMSGYQDDLDVYETARMDRVMKTLSAVSTLRTIGGEHPLAVPRATSPMPMATGTVGGLDGTWGSTFDSTGLYTQYGRVGSPQPGTLSPHASNRGAMTATQQQVLAQSNYMKQGQGSWRPGFTEVGRQGAMSPTAYGRQPTISVNTMQNKPQFTYQGAAGRSLHSELRQGAASHPLPLPGQLLDLPEGCKVVALYDYQAQRSDELSLVRGDILKVLYKDNDNWWMGELPSGQQGFFPTNFISTCKDETGAESLHYSVDELELGADDDDTDVRRSTTTALVSRSGELKFHSATEDSETEGSARSTRKKKKTKKPQVNLEDETIPPRGRKTKTRTLNESNA